MTNTITTCLRTCLLACSCLVASLGCIAEIEDEDTELRIAAQPQPLGGACDEEYYYVVNGATQREAQAACDAICEGVICADPDEDALACIPGNAGNANTWKCDCKCGCDDSESACDPDLAVPQPL
jgi:hypothetical protein